MSLKWQLKIMSFNVSTLFMHGLKIVPCIDKVWGGRGGGGGGSGGGKPH
jgi:hypothetical protein